MLIIITVVIILASSSILVSLFKEIVSFYENYYTEPWNEFQDPVLSPLFAIILSAASK